MYVDDSGKPDKRLRNNKFFGLSAVIINECNWKQINFEIARLKRKLSISEIHTRNIYCREKEFQHLNKNPEKSHNILEQIFNMIANFDITLISSIIDKEKYYDRNQNDDVETRAWTYLFERCDYAN